MRIFILAVAIILLLFSNSACATGVFYELAFVDGLKTKLVLRTFNEQYQKDFANADQVILQSAAYGEFRLNISRGTKEAMGIIPFAKWTILGIQTGQHTTTEHFAYEEEREQVIRNRHLSNHTYLGTKSKSALDNNGQRIVCPIDGRFPLPKGKIGEGIFALLLTADGIFIDQYYRRPSDPYMTAFIPCKFHSGEAYLYYTFFK